MRLLVKLTGKDRVIDMLAGKKRTEQLDCFGGLASPRGCRGCLLVDVRLSHLGILAP